MRSLSDDIDQEIQQAASGRLQSACRRRAEKNTDCLRMFCKAQPSVHIRQTDEIKSDGLRSNSKKAYAADAKSSDLSFGIEKGVLPSSAKSLPC